MAVENYELHKVSYRVVLELNSPAFKAAFSGKRETSSVSLVEVATRGSDTFQQGKLRLGESSDIYTYSNSGHNSEGNHNSWTYKQFNAVTATA